MKKIILTLCALLATLSLTVQASETVIEKHQLTSLKLSGQDILFQFYDVQGETAGRRVYILGAVGLSPTLKVISKTDSDFYIEVTATKAQTKQIDNFIKNMIEEPNSCELSYSIKIVDEESAKLSNVVLNCDK